MSQRQSGRERKPREQYMTPEWVVEALLRVKSFEGYHVWEPACGEGAVVRVLRKHGAEVRATDIDTRYCEASFNFLHDPISGVRADGQFAIITNPPYGPQGKTAEAFVRNALDVAATVQGTVAMLLPVDWDSGKTRRDLFAEFKHHITKIVLTDRIRWTNLEQSKHGPSQNHAWFIWDYSRTGRDMFWEGNETTKFGAAA